MLMPFTGKISILTSHSQTAFLTNVIEVLCFGRFLTCVQHSIVMCYSSGMGHSSSIGAKAVIFRRVETNYSSSFSHSFPVNKRTCWDLLSSESLRYLSKV